MGIYVWGTGCGASERIEAGLETERIAAFVDSFPMGEVFLGKPVLLPEQLPVSWKNWKRRWEANSIPTTAAGNAAWAGR